MKVWATVLCILSVMVTPTFGEPLDTVFLEELTWPELRTLVQTGKATMIFPIGGTEQNGPHMALGKHNARVRMLSERIARTLGNAMDEPDIENVPEDTIKPKKGN